MSKRQAPKPCGPCGGTGDIGVMGSRAASRNWINNERQKCGACNGTGLAR